jgi:hypothetical protein
MSNLMELLFYLRKTSYKFPQISTLHSTLEGGKCYGENQTGERKRICSNGVIVVILKRMSHIKRMTF